MTIIARAMKVTELKTELDSAGIQQQLAAFKDFDEAADYAKRKAEEKQEKERQRAARQEQKALEEYRQAVNRIEHAPWNTRDPYALSNGNIKVAVNVLDTIRAYAVSICTRMGCIH